MRSFAKALLLILLVSVLTACGGKDEAKNKDIDIDLSKMSGTAVYAEVLNMMTNPDEYTGKMVKMKGPFAYQKNEKTGKEYFACIIQDATACCAQGIEFETAEKLKYPDDYPKLEHYVTVTGEFDHYKEGEMTYCVLKNASMK